MGLNEDLIKKEIDRIISERLNYHKKQCSEGREDVDRDILALKAKLRLAILGVTAIVLGCLCFVIITSINSDKFDSDRFDVLDKYTVVDKCSKTVYYREVGKSLVVLYGEDGLPLKLDEYNKQSNH